MVQWQEALIVVAALLALSPAAHALNVKHLDVGLQGDRYVVEFQAELDAPADAVGAVLTDYAAYPELDPRIKESRVLSRDRDHSVRLYTSMRGCLGALLCRTMRRVEDVEERPDELLAKAVLSESDVLIGITRSQWQANEHGTQLIYRMEIMPKFWIPPLFGPSLMISTLRSGTLELFTNVEKVARERSDKVATQ